MSWDSNDTSVFLNLTSSIPTHEGSLKVHTNLRLPHRILVEKSPAIIYPYDNSKMTAIIRAAEDLVSQRFNQKADLFLDTDFLIF